MSLFSNVTTLELPVNIKSFVIFFPEYEKFKVIMRRIFWKTIFFASLARIPDDWHSTSEQPASSPRQIFPPFHTITSFRYIWNVHIFLASGYETNLIAIYHLLSTEGSHGKSVNYYGKAKRDLKTTCFQTRYTPTAEMQYGSFYSHAASDGIWQNLTWRPHVLHAYFLILFFIL